jgi:hypothetical protein
VCDRSKVSGMNEQQERALRAGLAALADRTRNASASPHVERAVLLEMQRLRAPARPSLRWLPLAAALLLATTSGVWLAQRTQPVTLSAGEPPPFVELPGTAVMPPLESGSIIRVSLPVTSLPSYGIQIGPDFGAGPVLAELLVAQDGYPRAIRLVNDAESSRSTP